MYRLLCLAALAALSFNSHAQIKATPLSMGQKAPFAGRLLPDAQYRWLAANYDSLFVFADKLTQDRANLLSATARKQSAFKSLRMQLNRCSANLAVMYELEDTLRLDIHNLDQASQALKRALDTRTLQLADARVQMQNLAQGKATAEHKLKEEHKKRRRNGRLAWTFAGVSVGLGGLLYLSVR